MAKKKEPEKGKDNKKKETKAFLELHRSIGRRKKKILENVKKAKKTHKIRRKKMQLTQMQVKQNQRLIKRIEALKTKSKRLDEILKGISNLIGVPIEKYKEIIDNPKGFDEKDVEEAKKLQEEYEKILAEFDPKPLESEFETKKSKKGKKKPKGKKSKLSRKNLAARKGWIPM